MRKITNAKIGRKKDREAAVTMRAIEYAKRMALKGKRK